MSNAICSFQERFRCTEQRNTSAFNELSFTGQQYLAPVGVVVVVDVGVDVVVVVAVVVVVVVAVIVDVVANSY